MLRIHTIQNAEAAKKYYSLSDYFMETPGEWLGNGALQLGLHGRAKREDFEMLCDNLDPLHGGSLTPLTRDGRRVGWDFNFNATKSVSLALELTGDKRVIEAHKEAVRYAMQCIEADMETRVRAGGRNENRTTGNLVGMQVVHRTTRPNKDDQLPDMSLHSHVVVFNATRDPVERKWKAAEIGQVKHDAPYYEAIYHNRLAANLQQVGYGIRRKDKAFEIEGISDELVRKFSRRSAEIEKMKAFLEDKYGVAIGDEAKSKLGATTRMHKVDVREENLTAYWVSRLTDKEKQQLKGLIGKPTYRSNDAQAVRFAIGHMFERKSVVDERRLYEAAIRQGIGSVTPEGVQAEAKRQGVLLKDRQATTREVLEEERRVIAFARDGRGTCRPMGNEKDRPNEPRRSSDRITQSPGQRPLSDLATLSLEQQAISKRNADPVYLADPLVNAASLSPEQQAICRHVWNSTDRVILIRGGAGTGKTHTMKAAIAGIDRPVAVLAPSAEASRGVLRRDGFKDADTVASFLGSEEAQEKVRNGVIWIDEAGLLGIRQVARLFELADQLNARVVLQGDRKQHASVERGATLRVLQEFAGLPVAELTDIRRQRGEYKKAVSAIQNGDILAGHDILDKLGWVKQTRSNTSLVDEYLAGLTAGKEMLVVAPTHAEGNEITAEIRSRLKEKGLVGQDERAFETLTATGWTEAERADPMRYTGEEVVQFIRNSGKHRAGDRIAAVDFSPAESRPEHFAAYLRGQTAIAAGDTIRITANGKSKDGHRLNNGSLYAVKGFDKDGDIVLANGWTVGKGYGHFRHGYVSTSIGGQGKTVDRVLIAMGGESLPAINAEQFYVSVSRGREKATVFTDLAPATLREAIRRSDPRLTATELLHDKPKQTLKDKAVALLKKARGRIERLREMASSAIRELEQKERAAHGR